MPCQKKKTPTELPKLIHKSVQYTKYSKRILGIIYIYIYIYIYNDK